MVPTTKPQRKALKAVYDRCPQYPPLTEEEVRVGIKALPISYRSFRRSVRPGPDCIMVPWLGMWLGIEADGYTHS